MNLKFKLFLKIFQNIGAESRTRTGTRLLAPDFESGVSTSFTTSAKVGRLVNFKTRLRESAPTYSSTGRPGSTMVARGLYFCVRDGNRCFPPALGTGPRRRVLR